MDLPFSLTLILLSAAASNGHVVKRSVASSWISKPQLSPSLCLTKGCVNAANNILNKMDPSADPCENFYQFACGAFIKETVIPEEKSSVSQFSLVGDQLQLKMQQLIGAALAEDDTQSTAKLKMLYQSCMNQELLEEQGFGPLQAMLTKLGGWPVIEGESWNGTNFDWAETMYHNRKLGYPYSYFVRFSVTPDVKNYSRRMINFDDPSLGMGRKYLIKGLNDSDVQSYLNYMTDIAVLMGAQKETAKQELTASLELEIKLANMSLADEKRRNSSLLYNRLSLRDLSHVVPEIPWLQYTNRLLEDAGHQVTWDESVNVEHPAYFVPFVHLLNETPKRVQANYLLWRAIRFSVSELHRAARDARLKYHSVVYGIREHKPRWKECLAAALGTFPIAAGSLYIQHHFDKQSKTDALTMVTDIHDDFDFLLNEIDWMDSKTRQKAIDKSKAIKYYIGYSETQLNETLVDEHYSELNITSDSYFYNDRNRSIWDVNYVYRKLREPVDKLDWRKHSDAAVVNAFYSPSDNSISFPAGILQGDFYSKERPSYLNYGAIGMVIGHEITHGFDDSGRQYDAGGELREWWQPRTRDKFLKSAQCIIDQYSNITVERAGMQVNGITTQGENIADNAGFKLARRAFGRRQRQRGREPALPGLQQFSSEQMFWLAAANVWCSVERPERLRLLILSDRHAPPFVRVDASLRNNVDFARDWQCPAGSGMHQLHRCGVW